MTLCNANNKVTIDIFQATNQIVGYQWCHIFPTRNKEMSLRLIDSALIPQGHSEADGMNEFNQLCNKSRFLLSTGYCNTAFDVWDFLISCIK